MDLRRASSGDAATLTEIAIRAKRSNGYDDAFMAACLDELTVNVADIESGEYWVVSDTAPQAFICLAVTDESGLGELEALFVDPDWQGQGIGKQLWLKALEWARSNHLSRVQLDADPAAVPFYTAMGFTVIGQSPSGSIAGRFLPRMEYPLWE